MNASKPAQHAAPTARQAAVLRTKVADTRSDAWVIFSCFKDPSPSSPQASVQETGSAWLRVRPSTGTHKVKEALPYCPQNDTFAQPRKSRSPTPKDPIEYRHSFRWRNERTPLTIRLRNELRDRVCQFSVKRNLTQDKSASLFHASSIGKGDRSQLASDCSM